MPGDDIRRIDWRVFARTDRFYVKEYEAETNTNFTVVLDVSASMRYGADPESGRVSKLTYGCFLAACLSYFSSMQRDRVGLAVVDRDVVEYVPNSAKHLQLILHTLDRIERQARDTKVAPGRSMLLPPLQKLSETFRRRSLVAVISDFYEDPDAVIAALNQLILEARQLLGTADKCAECGEVVPYVIGCPDGTELCQECWSAAR